MQLVLLTGIWFLVQKIPSWCEPNDSWLTENCCGHSGFIWGFFVEGNNGHKALWTLRRVIAWPLFASFHFFVEPRKKWVFSGLCYLGKGFCLTTARALCLWQILFVKVHFTGDLMQRDDSIIPSSGERIASWWIANTWYICNYQKKRTPISAVSFSSLTQASHLTLCRGPTVFHFRIYVIHFLCKGMALCPDIILSKWLWINGNFPVSTAKNQVQTLYFFFLFTCYLKQDLNPLMTLQTKLSFFHYFVP